VSNDVANPRTDEAPLLRRRRDMDIEARRHLTVLDAVADNERITQRGLSAKLGIALGLTNIYLKRMIRKGYIKCVNVQSNRLLYLITPQGIAEKTRLTYEFMDYSLHLYRDVRMHLSEVLRPLAAHGHRRIAVCGTGEAAELAYLCLKEQGIEPVAILDDDGGSFLGMAVRPLHAHHEIEFDRVIVATLDTPQRRVKQLIAAGVPREKLLTLQAVGDERVRPAPVGGARP
jgi:DNA-binding MarR family transcriptional regulator